MVDWSNIETVLLDMDGTLLDLHFDNYFWRQHLPKRYAEINGMNEDDAHRFIKTSLQAEHGKLNWYCTQFWAKQLKLDIVALKYEISSRIQLLAYVTEFLEALQHAGKTIILVTNAHRESYDLKMEHINLSSFFEHIVSAHDYGHPKEDQAFWAQLQQQLPFNTHTSVLIDDNEKVLNAALTYGIKQVLTPQRPDTTKPLKQNLAHTAFGCYSELLPISV